jgi:hypothetical protein
MMPAAAQCAWISALEVLARAGTVAPGVGEVNLSVMGEGEHAGP